MLFKITNAEVAKTIKRSLFETRTDYIYLLLLGMNPMLLNAQLQALNPLLSGMYGSQFHPGLLQVQQAAATAERLRAMASGGSAAGSGGTGGSTPTTPAAGEGSRGGTGHRYSPYPLPSPPTSSALSLSSPTSTSSSSAFSAVKKSSSEQGPVKSEASSGLIPPASNDLKIPSNSPPIKPQNSPTNEAGDQMMQTDSPTESIVGAKNEIKDEAQKSPLQASDIKNMEKLVNGLNGSAASKFGISHNNNDQQISA